ncbi:DUF3293 domain-containing protein [Dyella silvatica]|uniref:DUF3293 domain-containing protein n=1 Tax=Dyella silvatica TaxID=2992128 RepID=UPI002254D69A|nr:DUF3293 domain-containing protein [Dyella silvatica]
MDETLLAAYRATDYRVRLVQGGWASIRIEQPLPAALHVLIGAQHWGFVTAWHPRSQQLPRLPNRLAQRQLLADLGALTEAIRIRPALGVGIHGWREPSLLVIGPTPEALDTLARHYRQNAYVYGLGRDLARLRQL